MTDNGEKGLHIALLASLLAAFAWSAVRPYDPYVWALEVFPAVAGLIIVLATYKSFRLTGLLYILLWAHAIILVVGGHYTYARMPLFDWLKDALGFSRNYYDRVGHFAQGFVPAVAARELLLRLGVLKKGAWLFFLTACVALAISAFYEFIEWWVALLSGSAADDFLATQGDVWDTQWDMFLAFSGAILSQLLLGRLHDRQIEELKGKRAVEPDH